MNRRIVSSTMTHVPKKPLRSTWTDLWKILTICFSILTVHIFFSWRSKILCLKTISIPDFFFSSTFDFPVVSKSVCRDIYINYYHLKCRVDRIMAPYCAAHALLRMLSTHESGLNFISKSTCRSALWPPVTRDAKNR